MADTLPFDFLLREELTRDPYPECERLRSRAPVHRIESNLGSGVFLVVDYEHGRLALSDPRLSKDLKRFGVPDNLMTFSLLSRDPPDHTRLRRLLGASFTTRRIEELRPRAQEIAYGLADAMSGRDEAELIDDFAFPLPISVICELLGLPLRSGHAGLPRTDWSRLRTWSHALVAPATDADSLAALHRADRDLRRYVVGAVPLAGRSPARTSSAR